MGTEFTTVEKERAEKVYAEYRLKLENGNIIDHLKKMQKMDDAQNLYFHIVCPVMRAIRNDIVEQGRLYTIKSPKKLYYTRGTGPVECWDQRLRVTYGEKVNKKTKKYTKTETYHVTVKVKVRMWGFDGSDDGEITHDTLYLNPPISLFQNFDQKVFDKWANEVKARRIAEEQDDDLKQLAALIKKYKPVARKILDKKA